MPREHNFVTSWRCKFCNSSLTKKEDRTPGKIPDPNDPTKLIKCDNCGGTGWITQTGKTKADT